MIHMKKLFITLLCGVAFSQSSVAKIHAAIEKAIKPSFPQLSIINKKNLILTQSQFDKIKKRAKTDVRTKIYRYYEIKGTSKTLGYAVLINRRLRTRNGITLYVFDLSGTLKFTEILGFREPPEFMPNKQWMELFKNKDSSQELRMGRDIPTISGSTLSARCISDGARIARAIYEIVLKK